MLKTRLFTRFVESGEMTATELAERAGYTPEYLSKIRNGHHPITPAFAARMCFALKTPYDDLFYDDQEAGTPMPLRR